MENLICQSCGMPLYKPEMLGTNDSGQPIQDYCYYCFQDGKFTSEVTMDEMIKLCAKYVGSNNGNQEQYIKHARQQFPLLKRWAQKEDTEAEYYKAINKVLDYINEHINEANDIDTLSKVANISPFHFHRIFTSIIGENPGAYIQRLRLEYVAEKLRTSKLSLNTLADKTGYSSPQALSKAFKKRFGIPPSIYKITPEEWSIKHADQLFPRICNIYTKDILYRQSSAPSLSYNETWRKLYTYAVFSGLFSEDSESIGISFCDQEENETPMFHPALSVKSPFTPNTEFGYRQIKKGLFAVFTHKGDYKNLPNLYKSIWFVWLPESRYKLRYNEVMFEKYLNNPSNTEQNELLTEIYIPISSKK